MALTFDYGQRAARAEVAAARRFCRRYDAAHRVVKLRWLAELCPRALVERGAPLPHRPGETTRVWVPNRNGVFVAVAAAFAEKAGAPVIVAGFNAEEAVDFPDNSSSFITATNRALRYSTANGVRLISYTASMDKADIVKKAMRLGVPLENIYPCYGEGPRPCGRCISCRRTMAALTQAGLLDVRGTLFGRNA